jgi:hypothetical protein
VDLLPLLIAGAIAVASSTALSQGSSSIADAAAACRDELQRPEAGPADCAKSDAATTVAPTSLASTRDSAGAAEATPAPPPSDDVPPLLRVIQQSNEEHRQHEVEHAGGALFPSSPATDATGKVPATETATVPKAAVPSADGPQTDPPPNALFVPLGARRSAR